MERTTLTGDSCTEANNVTNCRQFFNQGSSRALRKVLSHFQANGERKGAIFTQEIFASAPNTEICVPKMNVATKEFVLVAWSIHPYNKIHSAAYRGL